MNDRKSKVLQGAVWLLAQSWYSKILGLISVVVLARCLTKEDFGIIAVCFLAKVFFQVISNFGSSHYIIRKEEVTELDLDNAWTINVISKLLITIIFVLLSGTIASYLEVPMAESALTAIAFSSVLIGLRNPTISLHQKKLKFKKLFYLQSIAKGLSTSLIVIVAYAYQSYWAVIIGELCYQIVYLIGSYKISNYIPRIRFDKIKEQLSFSNWLLFKGIVGYAKSSFDKIIIGKYYSVEDLGLYNFSRETSGLALKFVIVPLNSILYPSLSSDIKDKKNFSENFLKFLFIVCSIYIPVVFGGVLLSEHLISVVFGDKWIEMMPLFELFLIMTFSMVINAMLTDVITLLGEVKKQFYFEFFSSMFFIALILSISDQAIIIFTEYRVIFSYLVTLLLFAFVYYFLPISIKKLSTIVLPGLISSVVMYQLLSYLSESISNSLVMISIAIPLGILIYMIGFFTIVYGFRNKVLQFGFLIDLMLSLLGKVSKRLAF